MARLLGVSTDMRPHLIQSSDIDDRIGILEGEIDAGKRETVIHKLASQILGRKSGGKWAVEERDWPGEVEAMYNYVRKHVRYTRDTTGVEVFRSPKRTLELKIGDCDDLTILLGSLLQAVGYPIMIRVIGMKGTGTFQHVYLLAGTPPHDPKKWIPLDPSRGHGAGWEYPKEKVGLKRDYMIDGE